jgi:hypothetical protein
VRALAAALALVAAVCLLGACGGGAPSDGGTGTDSGGTDSGACVPVGGACSADGDCCTHNCFINQCS